MALGALEGGALVLFAVTIFFCILTFITVALRCFTRYLIRGFGVDDWLMLVGEFFGFCTCLTVLLGCKAGLGYHDDVITPDDYMDIKRAITSFQVLYCFTFVFVKSSICMALVRLTTSKRVLWVLYGIIALSASYGFISMMTVLTQCTPFRASWDPSAGTCATQLIIVNISYFVTACGITTDVACAILPYVILWNLQMKTRLKFTVAALLSLGFLASAATIIRIQYLDAYFATEDLAYKVSSVVLWSIIEIGIGIFVGSVPSLKPLVRSIPVFGSNSTPSQRGASNRLDDFQSYAMRSIGGHGYHKTHISGKGAKEHVVEESDSMKEILRDDGDRILVSSEVMVEGGRPVTPQKSSF